MSITQISKIRARRGHLEDLPGPLSSAEFGWATDARRLFIGNGDLEEGAPLIGNTEILTEHSDISKLSGQYIFTGRNAGYEVQTGEGPLSPVSRSLGDAIDDFANFRSFGGVGDGITNETRAFNRAIQQLHKDVQLHVNARLRRTLYIPAGIYVLSGNTADDYIKLLPYVKLRGDGKNATFIIQTNPVAPCVVGNVDTSLNTFSMVPTTPHRGYNVIEGITLINITQNHITRFTTATDTLLSRVRLQHSQWTTSDPVPRITDAVNADAQVPTVGGVDGLNTAGVALFGADASLTSQLTLDDCEFVGTTTAIDTSVGTIQTLYFSNCYFTKLYQACNIATGCDVKILGSRFVTIYREAVITTMGSPARVFSAHNTFTDVGNSLSGTPTYAALDFYGDNCYSIGDVFDRDMDDVVSPINLRGGNSVVVLPSGKLLLARQRHDGGRAITLVDGSVDSLAGVVGVKTSPTKLEYTVLRGTEQRTGTIHITPLGTTLAFTDDYVESTDLGITLTPTLNIVNTTVELMYSATTTTQDATLLVASRTLI